MYIDVSLDGIRSGRGTDLTNINTSSFQIDQTETHQKCTIHPKSDRETNKIHVANISMYRYRCIDTDV